MMLDKLVYEEPAFRIHKKAGCSAKEKKSIKRLIDSGVFQICS